ncbi:MAG: hypothetical protein LLF95_11490 [Bacteroidales bacterium]|nr:hypothetical protein [Bacteroidales bacterium]
MGLQHVDTSPYKAIVQAQTFGHLAPKPQTEYKGFILFTLTCFGETCIIEFIFDGLEASPWFNTDIIEYIGDYTDALPDDKDFGVYRFEGAYKKFKNGNHKFKGKVTEIPCGGKNI